MTNPSPGLPHPVRRVSPTSPNSAAITSSMLPIPMRRVIPDRRTWSELLRLPRTARRVSRTVQTNAASRPPTELRERASPAFPNCPTNAASRPPTAKQCGELLRLPRLTDIAPMQSGDCFSDAKQCGESSSYRRSGNEFPQLPRVTDITPMQSGDCLPGFTNQCGESSPDRQAMRRVPPELSKPVRRVSHRPPLRERASPASPNSPNQCGELSL